MAHAPNSNTQLIFFKALSPFWRSTFSSQPCLSWILDSWRAASSCKQCAKMHWPPLNSQVCSCSLMSSGVVRQCESPINVNKNDIVYQVANYHEEDVLWNSLNRAHWREVELLVDQSYLQKFVKVLWCLEKVCKF